MSSGVLDLKTRRKVSSAEAEGEGAADADCEDETAIAWRAAAACGGAHMQRARSSMEMRRIIAGRNSSVDYDARRGPRCCAGGPRQSCCGDVGFDGDAAALGLRLARELGGGNGETGAGLFRLKMAKGDSEGIGGVGGFGKFGHLEEGADHDLHLALVGIAVASYGGFHFAGRVAVDGEIVLGGGEQDDAADFREAEGGADVEGAENAFEGQGLRRELIDELADAGVNILQGGAEGFGVTFGGDAQGAVMEEDAAAAIAFDDAVTGGAGGGGVDAEHA